MSLLVSCCPVFSVRRLGPMCWLMLFRDALEQTMFKKPVDKKNRLCHFDLSWVEIFGFIRTGDFKYVSMLWSIQFHGI